MNTTFTEARRNPVKREAEQGSDAACVRIQ